jgi:hypothetical protein
MWNKTNCNEWNIYFLKRNIKQKYICFLNLQIKKIKTKITKLLFHCIKYKSCIFLMKETSLNIFLNKLWKQTDSYYHKLT